MNIYIIIDSNRFMPNHFFLDGIFKDIADIISTNSNIKLVMPRVIIDELTKNFISRIGYIKTDNNGKYVYDNLIKQFINKLTDKKDINISEWYEQQLIKKLTETFKAEILDIPAVDHAKIIDSYKNIRSPFKSKKGDFSGYKDFIIWESIIQLIKKHKGKEVNKYYFVSNDSDFFNNDKSLSPELEAEIKAEIDSRFFVCLPTVEELKIYLAEEITIPKAETEELEIFIEPILDFLNKNVIDFGKLLKNISEI